MIPMTNDRLSRLVERIPHKEYKRLQRSVPPAFRSGRYLKFVLISVYKLLIYLMVFYAMEKNSVVLHFGMES